MKLATTFNTLLFLVVNSLYCQQIGDITKADCFLMDCSIMEARPDTEFGYLTVPENYENPNGRNLQIAYVILKTQNPTPKKDPVIIFAGGWGMPEVDLAKAYLNMPLLEERDLILYDYRGIGHSTRLPCDNLGIDGWKDLMANLTLYEFYERQTQRYADCISHLESVGIDYNNYGMNTLARDGAFLAQQLPYDTYNLFGISYGTMAIQHFLKAADDYAITVRSALLDSNVPIGTVTQGTMATYYKRSLKAILDSCKANPDCNSAYPELQR